MIYNVLQYLEQDAEKYPDKLALSDENESMSYKEYKEVAQRIGTYIAHKMDGRAGEPIAVLIDRNIHSICAFMGIVYSGNFYVPIDSSMPAERIDLIYNTLHPAMVIDARKKEMPSESEVAYSEIIAMTDIDEAGLQRIRQEMIDTDVLYTIFTSGSTGVPKGVAVAHRSVIDLVNAFDEAFAFSERNVFANQAPFDFDVSVKDIYNALFVGASLHVVPKKLFKVPKLLVDFLYDRGIDTLIWAVSALRIISDFKAFDGEIVPALKNVMFSGEVMPVKALNYWMEHIPTARYVNLYGPTEITCNCTYYEVNKKFQDDEILPIGKAFTNSRVFLRDGNGQLIKKVKEEGEICVSGTCLALGYWNDPERTEAAFQRNPAKSAYESRLYATGDMGYYNEDGDIVFTSRRDHQIKRMGHRIELGELEAALNALPFIAITCCVFDRQTEKLACFYQAEKECKKEIVLALSKKLPKYMWPSDYVLCEEMPMNKNGKIDRPALLKRALQME